jgi:3-dehydroquinate synthase
MQELSVSLPHYRYPIYFAANGLWDIASFLERHEVTGSLFIITDERVAELYGQRVFSLLGKAFQQVHIRQVPVGEAAKSFAVSQDLYTWLIGHKADRKSTIIALGGGVVGDLAGYVAATYMRGIRFVQIPTTLLAQVDSSVGGKVGINHPAGKNLIGAFYHPLFVLVDPVVLSTLSQRDMLAGMAEVVKYGCIRDAALYEKLGQAWPGILQRQNLELLQEILVICCSIKAAVVEADEKEAGVRAILNFGHTVGHALETVTGYDYFLHGEAVAHGMAAAAMLSYREGHLREEELQALLPHLLLLAPPSIPRHLTPEQISSAMQLDKKRDQGGQLWVLLDRIGHAILSRTVAPDHVQETLAWLLSR